MEELYLYRVSEHGSVKCCTIIIVDLILQDNQTHIELLVVACRVSDQGS